MALTAYENLVAQDPAALAALVLTAAGTGWVPLGGVQYDPTNLRFIQTMVKGDVAGAPGTGDVYTLPAAATGAIGGVLLAPAQVASVAADVPTLVTDFNALLTKLRASGVLHT